jgi:hypothetical protein
MADDAKRRPKPVSDWADVTDMLEAVRLRPGMWVRRSSVQQLSTMLFGYWLALQVHGVPERFDFHPATGAFAQWLKESRGWPMNRGWATAIEENAQDDALELFFALLDEYQARPVGPGTASLDN